jgi:hypothetical protein
MYYKENMFEMDHGIVKHQVLHRQARANVFNVYLHFVNLCVQAVMHKDEDKGKCNVATSQEKAAVTCGVSIHTPTLWLLKPGGSMLHSQGLSNNPYPEPNQPNSSSDTHFFKIRSNIVLPFMTRPS